MPNRCLFVYRYLTMGGVERILISRAIVAKRYGLANKYVFCFLHASKQYVDILKRTLIKYEINDFVEVIERKALKNCQYDLAFVIDTPEALIDLEIDKTYMECHTGYKENRKYLNSLPKKLLGVLVPSDYFYKVVKNEVIFELKEKVLILPNFIPSNSQNLSNYPSVFNSKNLYTLARIDSLKNQVESASILNLLNKSEDNSLLFLIGDADENYLFTSEYKKSISNVSNVISLTSVPYHNTEKVHSFMRANKAIYISSSKNESFGLSVLEAMSLGVPVILSKIPAHSDLVSKDSRLLYKTVADARKKIEIIFDQYEFFSSLVKQYAENYSEDRFVNTFKKYVSTQ